MANKVLVTGADGFIGSHLTEALVREGKSVRAFTQYNSFNSWGWLDQYASDVKGKFEVFASDIRDPHGVKEAMKGCDAVLSQQSDLQVDVEDTAHLVLSFTPDTNGRRLRANLSMDFFRQDTTRTCVAIGESGSLRWNALSGNVEYFPAGATVWENVFVHAPQCDETYLAEWRHFLACLNAGTQPVTSGEDGLAALKIIEAARASAEMQGASAAVGGWQ